MEQFGDKVRGKVEIKEAAKIISMLLECKCVTGCRIRKAALVFIGWCFTASLVDICFSIVAQKTKSETIFLL